ncbi:MAG: metallopeptidase M23 family protein [uncultured bacterium]|nr:MAG: metallopeptidase M23 family protein [uncultured bacterium]
MKYPIDNVYMTQGFGQNPAMYKKYGLRGHNGIDFRTRFWYTPLGRHEITAAKWGTVIEVGDQGKAGYGKFVRIQHFKDEQTIYGHLTKSYVKVGQKIKTGEIIGISGNTGASTGPHLHFGFRPWNWKTLVGNGFSGYVDPLPFLK